MKIRVEATDVEQEFIIGIYKHKVKIIEATKSLQGWTDLVLEGSEINLLKVFSKIKPKKTPERERQVFKKFYFHFVKKNKKSL